MAGYDSCENLVSLCTKARPVLGGRIRGFNLLQNAKIQRTCWFKHVFNVFSLASGKC